ncbi:MAG: FAD binding domain-containing protein [Lysinibacillus sp.]
MDQNSLLQERTIFIPQTLDEVISLKKQFGSDFTYVAGATLLQLRWQIAQALPSRLIHLEQIPSLQQYELNQDYISIGAHTKLSDLRFDPKIQQVCPAIPYAIKTIAAPAVRNRGTVGGNVMGGEGDLIPLFLAMQAELIFLTDEGYETKTMLEWLATRQTTNDLLVNIKIPLQGKKNTHTFYKKIGRRETFTAAIVTVAGQVTLSDEGKIDTTSLAIGGGGNIPLRLVKSEQYLKGKDLSQIDWRVLYQSIIDQYKPATDAFVTNTYKQKVAANLLISSIQNVMEAVVKGEEHVYEV